LRSLIIDNDEAARTTLKMMLQGLSECEEAQDRETALNLFQDSFAKGLPFDLITLDIGMPDVGGCLIINEIRSIEDEQRVAEERRACIFVITAQFGRQLETDCLMQGCNDVVIKPFETKLLLEKLVQFELISGPRDADPETGTVVSTTKILDVISRRMKRGDLQLPPAPKIAMKVRQLITCNTEIEGLVDLLKQDLSIATKLISVSNSAFYRGVTKNTGLSQAVRRLGIDRTVEVVMSICCRGYFVTNHPAYKKLVEDLWWHSLACAHAIEMVIHRREQSVDEDLFSLGLLHDIGKLILIQVAADLERPKKSTTDIHFEELKLMMTAHHKRFGAAILKRWGYDDDFVALIRSHRAKVDPSAASAGQVLYRADLLARAAGFGLGEEDAAGLEASLEQLEYPVELQEELKTQLLARMDQLKYMFG
jgi:putative nucleotidyltransferase with HDIG domain